MLQLGLAMIAPPPPTRTCAMASGLTSGMTSGTPCVMRNADELSTTTAPAAWAMGPNFLLIEPPALNRAMSTPAKLRCRQAWWESSGCVATTTSCAGMYACMYVWHRGTCHCRRWHSQSHGKQSIQSGSPVLLQLLHDVILAFKLLGLAGRPASVYQTCVGRACYAPGLLARQCPAHASCAALAQKAAPLPRAGK